MIRRRDFITLLGGAAAWPLAARAQQPSQLLIGWLSARTAGLDADDLRAFRQGLPSRLRQHSDRVPRGGRTE